MAQTRLVAIPKGTKVPALPRAEFIVAPAEYGGELKVQIFHKVFCAHNLPSTIAVTSLTQQEARELAISILRTIGEAP